METGENDVTGGVELPLKGLANGVGEFVGSGRFIAAGDVDGTHLNVKSRGTEVVRENQRGSECCEK